jgi:hypothetical protein
VAQETQDVRGYQYLLIAIIGSYVVATFEAKSPVALSVLLLIQLATVFLALRISEASRLARIAGIGLAILGAVVILSSVVSSAVGVVAGGAKWWFIITTCLYLVAPIVIVRHLVQRGRADTQTLYGLICAYAMIGMSFAFVFHLVAIWQPSAFFGDLGDGTFSDDLFFSFTSLTTVGYGNLVPAENPGQTLAVLEAMTGQLFLVVVVARVVGMMSGKSKPESESETP